MAILEPAVESDEAIEKTGKKTKCAKRAPVTPVSKKCVHNPKHPKYIPLPPR